MKIQIGPYFHERASYGKCASRAAPTFAELTADIGLVHVQCAARPHLLNLLKSSGAFNGSPARRSTSSCLRHPERALQENLLERKPRGCQNCRRSRTTLANHEREWHVRTCAQACDCRRSLQGCRLT